YVAAGVHDERKFVRRVRKRGVGRIERRRRILGQRGVGRKRRMQLLGRHARRAEPDRNRAAGGDGGGARATEAQVSTPQPPQEPPKDDNAPGELIWEGSPTWRSRIGHTVLCLLVMLAGVGAYLVAAFYRGGEDVVALGMFGIVGLGLFMLAYQWIKLTAIK